MYNSFIARCWNSFLLLFASVDDTELDCRRKRVVLAFCIVALGLFLVPSRLLWVMSWSIVAKWISGGSAAVLISNLYITKRITDQKIGLFTTCQMISILIGDWLSGQLLDIRTWPGVVLYADLLLLCNAPRRYSVILITSLVPYLFLDAAERMFRFGFYDIPYGSTAAERAVPCDCSNPPCPVSAATSLLKATFCIIVFLLDFMVTRGFADGMLTEQKKLRESSELAEKVVKCLVRFDLELAEDILRQSCETEMGEVLQQLLCNLRVYRPYLPTALFEFEDRASVDVPVPGISGEEVAVVFTDIKSSSFCWEVEPEAMARALRSHNAAITQCIDKYSGYEVKTIGDSFMVAFSSIVDACSFGLSVHVKLLETSWPPELLAIPICMPDSSGEWGGLRVRIGVAWGEAVVEPQRTSDKFDYFGPIVNQAARIENACVPGSVSISESAYDELLKLSTEVGGVSELLSANCIQMPAVELRGIGKRGLWTLVPSCLPVRCLTVESEISGVAMSADVRSFGSGSSMSSAYLSAGRRRGNDEDTCLCKQTISVANISVHAVNEVTFEMNQGLQRVITSLERTSGIVISVVGSSVVAGWNVTGRQDNHIECCFRFVHYISRYETSQFTIGVSNGRVCYGRVGAVGQRFVTAIGPCVPLSGSLCSAAKELGTFCLYASTGASTGDLFGCATADHFSRYLRPVDEWSFTSPENCIVLVLVYQVRPTEIIEQDMESSLTWGWSGDYWEAFQAKDIVSIAAAVESCDPVLAHVLKLLSSGLHLNYDYTGVTLSL